MTAVSRYLNCDRIGRKLSYFILKMPFERNWNGCKVYDKWVEGDVTWVIQDLDPEDDDLAVRLYIEHFIEDEIMCCRVGMSKTEVNRNAIGNFWKSCVSTRTSLACYRHHNGEKELAAMNICSVKSIDDPAYDLSKAESEAMRSVIGSLVYVEEKIDVFKTLGVTQYLSGAGLLVLRKYRGLKLGARVLNAREPMCKQLGIKATATLFSGPASQKSAANCGFYDLLDISFGELGEAGFYSPGDQSIRVKVMAKIYY